MCLVDSHASSVAIHDSKGFYACWCIGMAILAGASATLPGVGPYGLVVFGAHAVWALYRLMDRQARIRVTREGIVDENFWYSPGLIPWEEILDVRVTQLGLIEVDLRDESAFWARLSPLRQIARFKHQLFGFGPALITPWGLDGSTGEVVGLLQAGLDDHVLSTARRERRGLPANPGGF